MMAISLDGKIAKTKKEFTNWTSLEDKKLFSRISKSHAVVIMGENTFKTFPAPLKDRLNVVFSQTENHSAQDNVQWVNGDPREVLNNLAEMGYTSALLGGGSTINTLFIQHKLVDKLIITVEPKIFGQGLSLFNKDLDINLKLEQVEKLNDNSLALYYQVLY